MSKIKDMIMRAEESDDEHLEKYRKLSRKMQELAEQWDGIYKEIEGVFPQKHKDTESDSPPF